MYLDDFSLVYEIIFAKLHLAELYLYNKLHRMVSVWVLIDATRNFLFDPQKRN